MKPFVLASLASTLLANSLLTGPALAAAHTPKAGSAERKALMDSLRPQLGGGKYKPIITPTHLKVEKGWAYISGGFAYAGGKPLEARFQEGSGTNFSALLHKEGKGWKVKRRLYHGDYVVSDFMQAFPGAPKGIFR